MFQVSVTLPLQQHTGTSNLPVIKGIEYQIAQQYGGYSSTRISGGWIDEATGDLYTDESLLLYTVVETQAQVDALLMQAEQWATDLQQIELFVTVSQATAHFITGTRAQARHAA